MAWGQPLLLLLLLAGAMAQTPAPGQPHTQLSQDEQAQPPTDTPAESVEGSSEWTTWMPETERLHYYGDVSQSASEDTSPPPSPSSSVPPSPPTTPFQWGPREAAILPPKLQADDTGMPFGAIAGIVAALLCLLAVAGAGVYVYVRRWRLANPPQTLSDKSSNPDSFGYIDDSVRDAEEMLSLDNDSFLNSLEAVTFQNYWTDSVRHTKL